MEEDIQLGQEAEFDLEALHSLDLSSTSALTVRFSLLRFLP